MRERPGAGALLELLKDPKWTEIQDIGAYLGFTHFLGQASQQRFTSRRQADQWQALKGPSGIDRLESIRTALRGRATTLAFGRRAEREEVAVKIAMRALEEWQGNATRLIDLQARAAAAGAETQAKLSLRLAAIEAVLPATGRLPDGFAERLSIARVSIEVEQRQMAQDRASLDSLRALFARFSEASALTETDGARLAAANAAITTATAQVSEAMLATGRAEQAAAAQAELVTRIEAEHREGLRVRTAVGEFGVLDAERQAAEADEAALKAARDSCDADVTSARRVLSRAHEAQAALSRLDGDVATLQLWSNRAAALQAQEIAAQTQRNAATSARAAADRAGSQLNELQRTFDNARATEATAEARLAARQRDASQLAELLSALMTHIRHEDTRCPVCASSFPEGELQTRARNSLAVQDAQLADDVRALDALRERTKAAGQAVTEAQSLISAAAADVRAAEAAETAAANERAAIAEGLRVGADSDLVSLLAERLTETSRARATLIGDGGGSPTDVRAAQARVETLSAARASLDERLASAVQRRTRCETALRAIQESLDGHPKPWTVEAADVVLAAHGKRLEAARASLEELTLKRAGAVNAEMAARERLAAAEAERDRIVAASRDANATRQAAVDAWQHAGMEGEPSLQAIEVRRAALADRASALAAHLEETTALSRSYEALLAQHELHERRALMDAQGGGGAADNPVPHTHQLQQQLQAVRAALRLTIATRDAVIAYGEQLKAQAESFSTEFLLPLNDLIDAFNRALLSRPGETVQFNAEHTVERTALAMQLRYADAIENAQYRPRCRRSLSSARGRWRRMVLASDAPPAQPTAGHAGAPYCLTTRSSTTTSSMLRRLSTSCATSSKSNAISSSCRAISATKASLSRASSTQPDCRAPSSNS
jgi:hypothetical protein